MIDYTNTIEVNPKVMLGKPVIKGTRITVELILEELSAGKTVDDLLKAYPRLSQSIYSGGFGFCSISKVIEKYGNQLYGSYTVIQPGRVRIRKLK